MKRIILSFLIVTLSISLYGQHITCGSILDIAKVKSISALGSKLRPWGYKMGEIDKDDDGSKSVDWYYGPSSNYKSIITVSFNNKNQVETISWLFYDFNLYKKLKTEIITSNWKYDYDDVSKDGIETMFKKDKCNYTISLQAYKREEDEDYDTFGLNYYNE